MTSSWRLKLLVVIPMSHIDGTRYLRWYIYFWEFSNSTNATLLSDLRLKSFQLGSLGNWNRQVHFEQIITACLIIYHRYMQLSQIIINKCKQDLGVIFAFSSQTPGLECVNCNIKFTYFQDSNPAELFILRLLTSEYGSQDF